VSGANFMLEVCHRFAEVSNETIKYSEDSV